MPRVEYEHALLMAAQPPQDRRPANGCTFHSVGWNELPADVSPSKIDGLVLLSDGDGRLPPVVAKLSSLRWVSVGSRTMVKALDPALLPNLEDLVIVVSADVVMPPGPWPTLRKLRASDARLSLLASELPALEELEMLFKTKKDLVEVGKLRHLKTLLLGPIKGDATLEVLRALPLQDVSFKRGNIADLRGLNRWPSLRSFSAIACNKLSDLSPLASMPKLEAVHFTDCPALKKVDALLEIPKLAKVLFWGCRDNGVLLKVTKKLRAKGVEVDT